MRKFNMWMTVNYDTRKYCIEEYEVENYLLGDIRNSIRDGELINWAEVELHQNHDHGWKEALIREIRKGGEEGKRMVGAISYIRNRYGVPECEG